MALDFLRGCKFKSHFFGAKCRNFYEFLGLFSVSSG